MFDSVLNLSLYHRMFKHKARFHDFRFFNDILKPFGKKPTQYENLLALRRSDFALHARIEAFEDLNQSKFSEKINEELIKY